MEYHIEIRGQHKVVFSAKHSPEGTFERVSREIDLSHTNLFLDANRPSAPTALTPLENEARAAFAALDGLTDSSPMVAALKQFRIRKLEELLNAAKSTESTDLIATSIFTNQKNKQLIERALKSAVTLINKELPHYFSAEKQLGTFEWLASGTDEKKLPCTLASKRRVNEKDETTGEKLLIDPSGRFVEFDADKKSAFVLSDKAIGSADILEALCNGGTLGTGALEINRAAALTHVAHPAIENIRQFKEMSERADQTLKNPPPSLLGTVAVAILPGTLISLSLLPPVIAHAVGNTLSAMDLVRTGLVVASGFLTAKLINLKLQTRKLLLEQNPLDQEFAAALKEVSKTTLARPITTLAMAAIDQVVSQSAGHAVTTLAPKSAQSWLHDFPVIKTPDSTLLPTEKIKMMGIDFTVPAQDGTSRIAELTQIEDFSEHTLTPLQAHVLGLSDVAHIYAIDRASESWNTLHATSLIKEFAERHNLANKDTPSLDLLSILQTALVTPTDATQTFPTVSQPFAAITAHYKLNRATWDQISRALASAVLLERLEESRRAQEIARAELTRALS